MRGGHRPSPVYTPNAPHQPELGQARVGCQELNTGLSMREAGAQAFGSSSAAFPGTLAGSRIGSRAASNGNSTLTQEVAVKSGSLTCSTASTLFLWCSFIKPHLSVWQWSESSLHFTLFRAHHHLLHDLLSFNFPSVSLFFELLFSSWVY